MSVSRDSRCLSSRSVNERKAERGMHMHEKVQFNWVNYFSIDWVLLNRVLEMNFSWQMFRAMIQSVFLSAIAYAACMGGKQFHWSLLDAANEIGVIDHKILDWHSARYLAARDVSEPGRSNNVHSTSGDACSIWKLHSNWPILLRHWILLLLSGNLKACMSIEERRKLRPHEIKKWKERKVHAWNIN